MAAGFPDIVFNSPQDRPVLRRIFSYHADYYDLNAYEKIVPGAGQRVWAMIEAERAHHKDMEKFGGIDAAEARVKQRRGVWSLFPSF